MFHPGQTMWSDKVSYRFNLTPAIVNGDALAAGKPRKTRPYRFTPTGKLPYIAAFYNKFGRQSTSLFSNQPDGAQEHSEHTHPNLIQPFIRRLIGLAHGLYVSSKLCVTHSYHLHSHRPLS